MTILTGIFHSVVAASGASRKLHEQGISAGHMMLLTPEAGRAELHEVAPEHLAGADGVRAGHVMGAVTGVAGGLLSSAVLTLILPGVGPIFAIGSLVTGAFAGATVGAAVGGIVQDRFTMLLPPEDVFVYEEALRRGCSLLIVKPVDERQRERTRALFAQLQTESVDELREHWWRQQRQQEIVSTHGTAREFAAHEMTFRHGFESALDVRNRGRSYAEAIPELAERDPTMYQDVVYRAGFSRGQEYYRTTVAHDVSGR
jgi:hypothetical protein